MRRRTTANDGLRTEAAGPRWRAICAMALVGVICCSAATCLRRATAPPSDDVITLVYWSATNAQELEFARRVADEWNARQAKTKVRVEPVPAGQSSEEVILAALASRTTPDIYANAFPGAMQDLLDAEGVVRLDDFADFSNVSSARMTAEMLAQYRSPDGHFYQMPWKSNPIMVLYNMRLLREAGSERPPRDYAEFLQVAARVTQDTDGDRRPDRWMIAIDYLPIWYKRMFDFYPLYLAASGGAPLVERGRVAFDNEAAVAVFSFMRELFARGYAPRQFFQGDPFLQGRIAARFTGPWSISQIERYAPAGFEYAFGPVPRPAVTEEPAVSYADPKSIVIFRTCRHPQAAWEFVKFVVSKENDRLLLEMTNQLPMRADLLSDPIFSDYFARHPGMIEFARQVPAARSVEPVAALKEIFDIIAQEFEESVVFGLKEPERAIRDAARRSQMVIDAD